MNISGFDNIRIQTESSISDSTFADITMLGTRSRDGFMVTAYEMGSIGRDKFFKRKLEVRRKDRQVALIAYVDSEVEVPEWWRDAEVLHRWTEEEKA